MTDKANFRYSESHEWFYAEGNIITIGLTQYAVNELTDVTYVEMKELHEHVTNGESIGEVESVKTTSEIFTCLDGEIVEINNHVIENPSIINNDPYGNGWLIKIKAKDITPLNNLLNFEDYDKQYPL